MHQLQEEDYKFSEDDEEKQHWWQVMRNFLYYSEFSQLELDRRQRHLNKLPEKYVSKLPSITFSKFQDLKLGVDANQAFLDDMVYFHASSGFSQPPDYIIKLLEQSKNDPKLSPEMLSLPHKDVGPAVDARQQHRNGATIHSLYREWSKEGKEERDQSFGVLVKELKRLFPLEKKEDYYQKHVLVPGCGLGRLPVEIASAGYCCEGNEYSSYMAIASNFMINGLFEPNCYTIYPWVNNQCNVVNVDDNIEAVQIPDIAAVELLNAKEEAAERKEGNNSEEQQQQYSQKFSMAAGNFIEIYGNTSNADKWDAVVTCFFLDTAAVAMEYIETIYKILKPGGKWINLGPLLYHWVADAESTNDDRYQQSVEVRNSLSFFRFEVIFFLSDFLLL
jgi:carnosine N-methyltransferase